jgi:hypothetical protein
MKKIVIYLSILASVTFTACELNEYPVFDDANAFVAFEKGSISVNEDAGSLKVPVHLTSLNAINTTVSFEIIDSTAIQGIDFELEGGASILTFNGSSAVQNIAFKILPHEGIFTGDRVFGVKITSGGSVNTGTINIVNVTISDLDHPLAFILGDFTAKATSYFDGVIEWNVTLAKDISDINKVWITNLVAGGSTASSPVYGIVNDDKTELKIPVGQDIMVSGSYNVLLKGYYGPDGEAGIPDGESITGLIDPNGTIHIQDEFGSQAFSKTTGASAGWYNIFMADGVFTKK